MQVTPCAFSCGPQKAVNEYVKSAQLPNVGRCGGGCRWQTFESLSRMSGNLPVRVLMGLGSVRTLATRPIYQ